MSKNLAPALLTEDLETGERPLGPALRRGVMCRCPNCGAGPLLKNYLTVRDHCPVCGEGHMHLTVIVVTTTPPPDSS